MAKIGMTGRASSNGFSVEITEDNRKTVLDELKNKKLKVMTMWGMLFETEAKKNLRAALARNNAKREIYGYKLTGNLMNSITFDANEKEVTVGSSVFYAPYLELGTIEKFEAPPEWEKYEATKGLGLKLKGGIAPMHFLRDAIQQNFEKAKKILETELKG